MYNYTVRYELYESSRESLYTKLKFKIESSKFIFSILSDIAVDDLTFKSSECAIQITTTSLPITNDNVIGNCDFEEGNLCQWYDDILADFKWTINSGPTSTLGKKLK